MALPFQALLLAATVLQGAVALRLARHAGPFRLAAAVLLAFNGFASLQLAWGEVPTPAQRWFLLADMPTGPWFLACAALLWRLPRHDTWDRTNVAVVGGAAAWTALILVPGAMGGYEAFVVPGLAWLHDLPAFAGLGLMVLAVARALRTSDASQARLAGLVGAAYLPIAFYYLWVEGLAFPGALASGTTPWPRLLARLVFLALAIPGLVLLAAPRARRPWSTSLLMIAVAMLLLHEGLVRHVAGGLAYEAYVLVTLSIYLARPLLVAMALDKPGAGWSLYDASAAVTLLLAGKAVTIVILGTPATRLVWDDLAGLGVTVALLPVAWQVPRWWARRRDARVAPDRPSSDERLAQLLVTRGATGPTTGVGKRAIEEATDITENNVAAAVRRLERRLDPGAPAGTFVAERVQGVRGRKVYWLTEEGTRRLAALGHAPPQAPGVRGKPTRDPAPSRDPTQHTARDPAPSGPRPHPAGAAGARVHVQEPSEPPREGPQGKAAPTK